MNVSSYCLLLLACVLSGSQSIYAQTPQLTAKADALFADWNKPGRPGAAVGVVHQGKLVYAKGFGEADLETGAPITPQTVFDIASVSKQFTAYAIVLLSQQGKLSLEDDIRTYLPEVPHFGKTITIRHLLNHTSGLRDQLSLQVMAGRRLDDVVTKDHNFNLIKRQKELNFEPGTAASYSNTGYTLLAELVSRVTGQPFPDWMQQHVFKPLGMNNTQFYDNHEQLVKGRAYSFHQTPSEATFSKSSMNYVSVGPSSLLTTVNDLARWIGNFRAPTVGDPATMTQMLEKGRLTNGDTVPFAMGLIHSQYRGLSYYGHTGAYAGYRASLTYFPTADYGFIVLSNQAEFNAEGKALELASLYLAPHLAEAKKADAPSAKAAFRFDSTRFGNYAGWYKATETLGFMVQFRREGGRYFSQASGQIEFELLPLSDTTFSVQGLDAVVVFHPSRRGPVRRVTWWQNGSKYAYTRTHPKQEPTIQPEQFIGKYYSPELETIYTIEQQGEQLKLIHVQHGEITLRVLSRDRLFASWWFILNMDVVRDASNRIIGLRTNNGRVHNVWFQRLSDDFPAGVPPTTKR